MPPPGPASATYTVPTGLPSCGSGPATPVTPSPHVGAEAVPGARRQRAGDVRADRALRGEQRRRYARQRRP